MPIKVIDFNSTQYNDVVKLRYELLRKPLGLSFTDEELAAEGAYTHIASYDDDKLLGTCMLTPDADGQAIKLRQMAVKSGLQGKGIGQLILQFAENISRDKGYKKIYMNARKTAVDFYLKSGYTITGQEFNEVTIPHYVMEKNLPLITI